MEIIIGIIGIIVGAAVGYFLGQKQLGKLNQGKLAEVQEKLVAADLQA
jgi:uncharacterized protein YneF (UPF0154 family)